MESKIKNPNNMIHCVGRIFTKCPHILDLLMENGYLLEKLSQADKKYPNTNPEYMIFVREEDDGK